MKFVSAKSIGKLQASVGYPTQRVHGCNLAERIDPAALHLSDWFLFLCESQATLPNLLSPRSPWVHIPPLRI